jgi:hypothetical protein
MVVRQGGAVEPIREPDASSKQAEDRPVNSDHGYADYYQRAAGEGASAAMG